MRVIIAGSRDIVDYNHVVDAVNRSGFTITTVISGGAAGVDQLGERYAVENNLPLEIHMADWETHGRAAGPIRNKKMASVADALIAVWDSKSRGTANMIKEAGLKQLKVYVYHPMVADRSIEDWIVK